MPSTPLSRHNAAVKAAATKRRNAANARANGFAPPSPRPRPAWTPPPPAPPASGASSPFTQALPPPPPTQPRPPAGAAFTTKPTVSNARLAVVKALEDLFVLVCRDTGITDERRHAFEKYKAALVRALAPSVNAATQTEADTALRIAATKLIALTF
jgi:hypothetical protein